MNQETRQELNQILELLQEVSSRSERIAESPQNPSQSSLDALYEQSTEARRRLYWVLQNCWETVLERAKDAGHRDGTGAGEWIAQDYFGGRTKSKAIVPNAKNFLAMHEEGDPAIYDGLNLSPLAGEYAGDLLPKGLICDVLDLDDGSWDALEDFAQDIDLADSLDALKEQICSSYEDSYSNAMMSRLVEIAQGIVDNDNENNATK